MGLRIIRVNSVKQKVAGRGAQANAALSPARPRTSATGAGAGGDDDAGWIRAGPTACGRGREEDGRMKDTGHAHVCFSSWVSAPPRRSPRLPLPGPPAPHASPRGFRQGPRSSGRCGPTPVPRDRGHGLGGASRERMGGSSTSADTDAVCRVGPARAVS